MTSRLTVVAVQSLITDIMRAAVEWRGYEVEEGGNSSRFRVVIDEDAFLEVKIEFKEK